MLAEQAALDRWVTLGRPGGSLTAADRQAVLDRIRGRYQTRGQAEPTTIDWVGSPSELNRRWAEQRFASASLGRRIATAPVRFLLTSMLRAAWLGGHVLLGLLVLVLPPTLLLVLSLLVGRAFGKAGQVLVGLGFVALSCAAGLLWEVAVAVVRRAWNPKGSGRLRLPSPDQPSVIDEMGPGPQADPVPGWIGSDSLVLICEPPLAVRTESVGAAGERRLHCESGPAVEWNGRPGDYYLHGVPIPRRLYLNPTIDLIHREQNSEVRRLAIERIGWQQYIQRANLRLVAAAPDPGNPGHELLLYDLPKGQYEPARLLLMVNGSPDRSGRRRRYAELVPDWIDDPVQAVAWQYGCPVDRYRQLARRT
ncbi:MAG TPA: hypothetical protein VLL08_26355 [Kineosporiaceae bacterium]|nr:hypothetical protein [Kineosporiaceae bacterium]